MWIYVYPNNTETEITNLYVGIPNPESITLDKSSITLTTVGQTEQLTATVEPTISDHSITWSSDDTTVATVSTTGLVTCVTPWIATITATTVNGLTATCGVTDQQEWQPTANTLVYWKLDGNLDDSSWNNRNWTGNITYEQLWSIQVWKFNWAEYVYRDDSAFDIYGSQNYTYNMRIDTTQFSTMYTSFWICESWSYGTQDKAIDIFPSGYASAYIWQDAAKRANSSAWSIQTNTWYNLASTFDWSSLKLYINWQLAASVACTSSYNFSNPRLILSRQYASSTSYFYWFVSKFIMENKARTAQEIEDYFDLTKWTYGVS